MKRISKRISKSLKQEIKQIYSFVESEKLSIKQIDFSSRDWEEQFIKNVTHYWLWVVKHHTFSKAFIDRYQLHLEWGHILIHQKLHKNVIKKYFEKIIYQLVILKYQKLDENFIEYLLIQLQSSYLYNEFLYNNVLKYHKVSKKFIDKYKLTIPETCWLYKTPTFIESYIRKNTNYEIHKDTGGKFIIAYKGILRDRYSLYTYQYRYFQYHTYTSHCDCNIDNENSFGLSAWTENEARDYCSDLVVRVKIYIKDIGCFVHNNNKIRCRKFTVLD